jgi:hypothetical protein
MFQHIGRRIFLEQPARKNPAPAFAVIGAGRALHHGHADKGPLIGIGFPRRSALTGAHKQCHFAKAYRFPRFQFKVAGLTIAFVQKANDCDPLRHGRAGLTALGNWQTGSSSILAFGGFAIFGSRSSTLLTTCGQHQRCAKQQD